MRFNTVSTADQYIIAYQPFYRQTLLLSPLKSLWREALWVITHLQQQLAQLKLSEDTVVAELEPQVRVAKGDAVLWCHIAGDWRIWWGILICSFLPTCKAKVSWHFGSGRLRYDTVPPKKFSKYSKMIPHMMPPFTVYIFSCLDQPIFYWENPSNLTTKEEVMSFNKRMGWEAALQQFGNKRPGLGKAWKPLGRWE